MLDQAIVFVTHSQSEHVLGHFGRLHAETHGLLATFLCVIPLENECRIRLGGNTETHEDMLATELRVNEESLCRSVMLKCAEPSAPIVPALRTLPLRYLAAI
jgi:hypothetical protein